MNRFFGIHMILRLAFSALLLLPLPACDPAHKATASKKIVHNELCAEAWLEYPNQPHPMWEEVKAGAVTFPDSYPAPAKYIAYRINPDTLRRFFGTARNAGRLVMVMPVSSGCEAFTLKASAAMSGGLQEKYPDIISLQGNGVTNKTADLRLDWDGRTARGQMRYHGDTYYLVPAAINGQAAYVLYDKEDAGEAKQPFEATPDTTRKETTYDR